MDHTTMPCYACPVPTISFFQGVAIRMFFNDHAPAHFHAYHGGREAKFDIETGRLIGGRLPLAQRKLVQRWIEMYKTELRAAWIAVRNDMTPERIPGPDADNDN
ncbi:DUF4160 domain-containing protein [Brevundimonas sp.]|uniref:DUF4160 domain-containing protein n=1 Tax=Brevundimonas sp. TaxID=1871086 RepID=UPI00272B24D9|nr:DUF4160 domain-containing protein [Brevundimonas sp.]MDZ4062030.1 DUF4160 domain-containing protein [Brevundimonas sp.]